MTSRAIPKVRQSAEYYFNDKNWYWRDSIASAAHGKFIMLAGSRRITTPTAFLKRNADVALSNNVEITVQPDTIIWDNYTWYDQANQPTRLTAREGGLYLIGARARLTGANAGLRALYLRQDGTDYINGQAVAAAAGETSWRSFAAIHYLEQSHYVEVRLLAQAAGVTLTDFDFWIVAITPEGLTSP